MAAKKDSVRARLLAALEDEKVQPKELDFSSILAAQERLARKGIGVAGRYSLAPFGKNVMVEGVLSRTVFIPETFDQAHSAAKELRGENGRTCVEVFATRIQDGIEFLRVRKDPSGLRRAESVLTDERGIILSTAEAQLVRQNVAQQNVQLGETHAHEQIRVDGFRDPETGAWVCPDDLEHDDDSEETQELRLLDRVAVKSHAQLAFERLRAESAHDVWERKDPVELAKAQALVLQEKLRQKWADIAAVAAGVKVAPAVEPVVEKETPTPVRMMTPAEFMKNTAKALDRRNACPVIAESDKVREKIKSLNEQLLKMRKEISRVTEENKSAPLVWNKYTGDWEIKNNRLPRLEKMAEDIRAEIRWAREDLRELTKV